MRKIVLTLTAVVFVATSAFSQLSQRENDESTFKIGTRPASGDMALTFGMDITGGGGIADLPILNQLASGDLLTFRYYMSKDLAIRAGIKLYKDAEALKGDEVNIATNDFVASYEYKTVSREYIIAPGIEKHFSSSNIFDVYAGGDLYIGLGKELNVQNEEYANGDYDNNESKSTNMILGAGGVVGFNIFIAQLPISLGFEYGLNMKWSNEGKTKVTVDQSIAGVTASQEYYTATQLPGTTFSKVRQKEFGMDTNNNVRIILNIYFGK